VKARIAVRQLGIGLIVWLASLAAVPPAGAQGFDDLFNTDVVQRIDLLVNSRDWDKLKANFQENEYYPADLRWNGLTVRNVGIRSRGLGSRSGTKPGLRVDFNRYAGGQTLLELKSLVLDNLTQDASGIHERIAMRFYERMGLPAPRESHAALYINNEYAGLYAVVESVDKDLLRRVFGQNDGYLFEYKYLVEWFFNYPGPGLDAYTPLLEAKTHETASIAELYSPLDAMFRTINEASDDQFVAAVGEFLDLPLFVRYVAVQNFLAEWDGILGYAGVNNFYLYRFENSQRSQFIPWDDDNAFRAIDFPILEGHDRNVLMRRAMAVPALRALYFDTLLAAAASATEVGPSGLGWLEEEVRREVDLITNLMMQDTFKPFTNENFAEGARFMLEFAQGRPAFVRAQVAAAGRSIR
jgi:spore coat protein CotH